ALVGAAMALPEDNPRFAQLFRRDAPAGTAPVPEHHFVEGDTQVPAGISPKVLVGEEEDLVAALKSVFERLTGVAGGADDAFAFADERFQAGCAVHVGDRNDFRGIAKD